MLIQSRAKRLGVVILSVLAVIVLLAVLEPGYSEICNYSDITKGAECARHNVIFITLWHMGQALDRSSAAITALATAAIGGFTWTLWRATSEQGKLTREAIDDAKKSSERQLRAYISVIEARRATANHTADMQFKIVIKNTGATPSYQTVFRLSGAYGPCVDDVYPSFPVEKQPVFSIGPGEPVTGFHKLEHPLTPLQLADIAAGIGAYFIRCRVDYVDAFHQPRILDTIMAYAKSAMDTGHIGMCDHGHTDT